MHRLFWVCFGLWGIAFVGAFVAFSVTPPDDFGFTAGLNRLEVFLQWQAGALFAAILCLVARSQTQDRLVRRLALVPIGIFAVLVLAVILSIAWFAFIAG